MRGAGMLPPSATLAGEQRCAVRHGEREREARACMAKECISERGTVFWEKVEALKSD